MSKLATKLLRWWDKSRRDLPWRAAKGARADPYRVWLSEIMLQQTTVASVKAYFEAFVARWPNVEALAAAPLDDVLAAWAGLGYYARAHNLHACARLIARERGGRFPQDESELLRLPGVGPYTAAAIASIAFEQSCVAVDGNVERVTARLFAISEPLPRAKRMIAARAATLWPERRPGDFLQALMDLGASLCAPRAPNCAICPLSSDCEALRAGNPEDFPVKAPKQKRPARRGAVFVLRTGDRVLLRRRPDSGLLGGMSEFPSTPLTQDIPIERARVFAPATANWTACEGAVRHVFTHFSLELVVFIGRTRAIAAPPQCRWVPIAQLAHEALPTVMRKAAAKAGLSA